MGRVYWKELDSQICVHTSLGFFRIYGSQDGNGSPAFMALTHIWVDYDLGITATGIPDQATLDGWSLVMHWCTFFFFPWGHVVPPMYCEIPPRAFLRTLSTKLLGQAI
jgi:hypothetical protein